MKRGNVSRLSTVPGPGSDETTPLIITTGQQIQPQPGSGAVNIHTQQSQGLGLHENSTPHQTTIIVSTQQVINYSKTGALQYAAAQLAPPKPSPASHMAPPIQHQPRHKTVVGTQSPGVQVAVGPLGSGGANTYQRLKVEDALSYLDQVKFRFNNQPQVYNDFLDIMKEFKSQSIDTPGVIARVSNLFKGHPELIVGFNTFLPPGYKIEVQANDQGYAYQVSVSIPSPNSGVQQAGTGSVTHSGGQPVVGTTGILVGPTQTVAPQSHPQHNLIQILPGSTASSIVHSVSSSAPPSTFPNTGPPPTPPPPPAPTAPITPFSATQPPSSQPTNTLHHISQAHQQLEGPLPHSSQQPVEFNHAIEYVNKIKSRFSRQPEKYKRFLEILHKYQREQKELKEQPQVKQQTEQEVYAQVAKLFENQDDLLMEFGQFLPDATGGGSNVSNIGCASVKSVTSSLENNRSQEAVRPRTAAQSQQRGSGGMDPMLMENESNFHSVSARPASPGYTSTVTTGPLQTLPPRSQDASLPSHHPPAHHHQKHSHHSSGILSSHHHLKRSPSFSNNQLSSGAPPPKKHKLYSPRDVSLAEASKYGTLSDFSFFDRVRKFLHKPEVYDNFIRCLMLFTNEIISKTELLTILAPFFSSRPEFQRWMQDFLGPTTPPPSLTVTSSPPITNGPHNYLLPTPGPTPLYTAGLYSMGGERYTGESDTIGALGAHMRQDRPQGDAAMDIDLSTCKRLGTSYCALPKGSAESAARRCSGRTALCREVLNDSWVSFPTWAEDSTFVTSRKTQYEEYIYRCEDERFELDVVIETNASTILALEGVHKKLCRMSSEEAQRFRLDDCLGGSSPTIHQRALRRIYGEKAPDIISGLKKNPLVAVPVVLRRLKAKEEEWREAQKGFNKQWREQNEKYYLKSLDHQGINFKQNDLKALRSKSLVNEIETLYDERREHIARVQSISDAPHPSLTGGPHLCARLGAGGVALLSDATDLLIHHVRRQTAVQKQEKQRIKQILKHFLPDLFSHPRMPLSDDERDDDDKDVDINLDSPDSVNEDAKPVIVSCNDKDVDMVDSKPSDSIKSSIKQERDGSSESDSNASHPDKISRRCEKLSNKENKENIKSRNNSEETDDPSIWSKSNDNSMNAKATRQREGREGSSDSGSAKVKLEPADTTPATDIMFTSLNSLQKEKWSPPSSQGIIFYGNAHWYVFLRLHSVLCQRLAQMKQLADKLAQQEDGDCKLRKPATATALRLKPDNTLPVTQYYSALLEMVRSVLDGNLEATAYEDGLREMFGIHAFVAFTLDKIVSSAVRQLQQCVQDRVASKCVDLHIQERTRLSVSGNNLANNVIYQRKAEKLLKEEHAFKMCIYGGDDCRVTFELLDSGGGTGVAGSGTESRGTCSGSGGGSSSPPPVSVASHSASSHLPPTRLADWDMYRERFANPGDSDTEFYKDENFVGRKAVYLPRNVRKVKNSLNKKVKNGLSSPPKCHSPTRDDGDKIEPTPINKQLYIHDDMQECSLVSGKLKPTYIAYKGKLLYKIESLKTARKSHKRVTLRLDERWQNWLRIWSSRHVTGAMSRGCAEWFKRGTRTVARGSTTSPPYRVYTTYSLIHHTPTTQTPLEHSPNSNIRRSPSPTPVSVSCVEA